MLHQVTVISEAVKRLSQGFRELHPILPWQLMASMRDHLIHGYDAVDLDEVWQTASHDVPEALGKLEPLVPRRPVE